MLVFMLIVCWGLALLQLLDVLLKLLISLCELFDSGGKSLELPLQCVGGGGIFGLKINGCH